MHLRITERVNDLRSIMTDNLKVCYYCGTTENVELHHCIHGNKHNRSLATQYHLLIGCCGKCHRGINGIHGKYGKEKDVRLQAKAQEAWEQRRIRKGKSTPDKVRDEWIEIFGVDYIAIFDNMFADIKKELSMSEEEEFKGVIDMDEYIIVGDSPNFNECLIYTCGTDKELAEDYLDRILNYPTENDKKATENMTNIKIKKVSSGAAWWNDSFLVN